MAAARVIANSRNSRPRKPPMKNSGMNTASRDRVIETMVKPISRAPSRVASRRGMPFSRCRAMFSMTTIASSTTKPIAMTSAISDRLFKVKPRTYMIANAPASDSGTARPAINVGASRRRNSSMVSTTRPRLISSEICTSMTEARIVGVRSRNGVSCASLGSQARSSGSSALTESTVAMTFASACLRTNSRIARWPFRRLGCPARRRI